MAKGNQPRGEAVWGCGTRRNGSCGTGGSNAALDEQLARFHRLLQCIQHGQQGVDACGGDQWRASAHAVHSQGIWYKTSQSFYGHRLRGVPDDSLLQRGPAGGSYGSGNGLSNITLWPGLKRFREEFEGGVRGRRGESLQLNMDDVFLRVKDITTNKSLSYLTSKPKNAFLRGWEGWDFRRRKKGNWLLPLGTRS